MVAKKKKSRPRIATFKASDANKSEWARLTKSYNRIELISKHAQKTMPTYGLHKKSEVIEFLTAYRKAKNAAAKTNRAQWDPIYKNLEDKMIAASKRCKTVYKTHQADCAKAKAALGGHIRTLSTKKRKRPARRAVDAEARRAPVRPASGPTSRAPSPKRLTNDSQNSWWFGAPSDGGIDIARVPYSDGGIDIARADWGAYPENF